MKSQIKIIKMRQKIAKVMVVVLFFSQATIASIPEKEIKLGSSADGSIQHKITLAMLAFQQKAVANYSGAFNATVSYSVASGDVSIEMLKKLNSSSDLIFSNTANSFETQQQLGVRWQ